MKKQSSQLQSWMQPSSFLSIWDNPGKVIDQEGRSVDTSQKIWRLHTPSDSSDLNWETVDVAFDIKEAIKAHVAHIIETKAAQTANQVFTQLKYCFARMSPLASITDVTYEALEGLLFTLQTVNKAWHFHYIRKWYQWCDDQGIPGFKGEIAAKLYLLKVHSNSQGIRVMTRDVNDGPLSYDEHYLVRRTVLIKSGTLIQRVIIAMLLELGARPIQLVQLEQQDFNLKLSPSGHPFYSLNVPRAKQGTVGEPEKKRRRISHDLGQLIEELITVNHYRYGDRGANMPILCADKVHLKKLTDELQEKYELHLKIVGLAYRVKEFAQRTNIVSPRTGKILNLHPRRLRYTFFTMLAEQGTAINHLAELADHSNNKSIWIYVASTSNVVDRLNVALGKDRTYADTINRFMGKVIQRNGEEEPEAIIFGSTPTLKNLGGIGLCGANFLCSLYPPLSCYICPKFQAWRDGPHKELLLELETYVHHLVEKSSNASDRIPHQLVDVITAIRQLLRKIEELNNDKTNKQS